MVYGVLKVFKFKHPIEFLKWSRKGYKLGNKISNINGLFSTQHKSALLKSVRFMGHTTLQKLKMHKLDILIIKSLSKII